MKCSHCGRDIPEQVPYCRYCGEKTGAAMPAPVQEERRNRIPLIVCACVVALGLGAGLWFWLRPAPQVQVTPIPTAEPAPIEETEPSEPASVVLVGAAHGDPGETLTLTADIFPVQAAERTVWTSSNEDVATVADGVVTCVAPGETTLRVVVTLAGGEVIEDSYVLTVYAPKIEYHVEIQPGELTLKAGSAADLTLTLTPEAEGYTAQWQTSDNLVAAVTDGRVQAVGEGSATVTVKVTVPDGRTYLAPCSITVEPADPAPEYTYTRPAVQETPSVFPANPPMVVPNVIPANEEAAAQSDDNYLIANSARAYITVESLKAYSTTDLILARNEIYARHGRRFTLDWIQSYFDKKSWYKGTVAPEAFDIKVFNAYELVNLDRIKQVEDSRKD